MSEVKPNFKYESTQNIDNGVINITVNRFNEIDITINRLVERNGHDDIQHSRITIKPKIAREMAEKILKPPIKM